MKRVNPLIIAGFATLTLLPVPAVMADERAAGFDDVSQVCAEGRCKLFSSLPPVSDTAAAPLRLTETRRFSTSPDGINLLDVGLGGLAGALIGDEIGGTTEAAAFGLLGAGLVLGGMDGKPSEEEARRRDEAWRLGTDMYFNPAHPLPATAHWLGGRKSKND